MKTINSLRSKLLALTLALMASVSSFAKDGYPDFQVDGLYYNFLEGDSVQVTFLMPPTIPTEVAADASNKKNVSGAGYVHLTEIIIPSTVIYEDKTYHVTRIGHGAFMYCPNLMHIDLPTSIKSIGKGAFHNCRYLSSITLNEGLESIEQQAFWGCPTLKEVSLPSTLKSLKQKVFLDSKALSKVICKALVPPSVEKDLLTGTDNYNASIIPNATLYVPAEFLEAYKTAAAWKEFGQILPIEPTSYKSQWCDTWNVFVENGSVYPPHEETYRYQLAQDIVIGDYTYTAVVSKAINDALDAPHYVAAVRFTDDRKVYIYYDNAEYLLYDFNVQEGDELEVFAGINNYTSEIKTYKCRVIGIEQYTCIGCPATITLHVQNNDLTQVYRETQWIEGVGDINGFLNGVNGYAYIPGNAAEYLLCAYQGDELKYTGDLYEEYGCGDDAEQSPEDLFPTLWGLQRTSCTKTIGEDEYGTVYGSRSTLMEIKQNMIIDGKQYVLFGDGQNYNSFLLREKGNKVFVYSSLLRKDLVLYDYTLEVGDSLPALYIDWQYHDAFHQPLPYNGEVVDYNEDNDGTILPADTFIVTNISTITLLDGKEHKKWTFNNGMQYVEGIGSYRTSYAENDFYQLIANVPQYSDADSTFLVCVSKDGKLLYQMDNEEMERLGAECLCEYNSGPKKDNAKNGKIGGRPTPTQWNMLEVETKEMDGTPTILRAETFSYTLENDSIVTKGKTFYQLARQSTKDTAITKSFVGALHFGEDEDNRVYFLRDGVEYVLYDFTAEPGDTIEIFAGINNYPQETTYTHVVVDKDTTEDGACRMFLEVVFPDETTTATHAEKVWLAGLGSIDGIVHNAAKRTSDAHAAPAKSASSETQTSVMLCAWREDSCLYTTNHPEYDTFGCVYNQDPTALESPTSPSSYQKILREGQLLIMHDGKIYTVMGVEIK